MFLTLVTLMSGFMFACRIFDVVVDRRWSTRIRMTKIGTLYFISLVASAIFISRISQLALWLSVFAPLALLFLVICVQRICRARAFRARFRESLTLLLLRMKAGKSFRLALDDAIAESDPRWRHLLAEIRELVVFSQQTERESISMFARMIIEEFRAADRAPHAAIRRIEQFRDRLRLEDEFRHRSGQVLRQIRAQSLLLGGLYLAVLAFVARQFGFSSHGRLLLLSGALFFAGLAWIWIGGRRFKWKT